MEPSHWWELLYHQVKQTSYWEWTSTISQITSVYFAQKNNVFVYPTGILGVVIAAYLYFFVASPPLYAEGCVHIYYFFVSLYGWWVWTRKNAQDQPEYPILWCTHAERLFSVLIWTTSWLVLYLVLDLLTDSNTPELDSFVSSSAITAMWLMAKRKVENWLFWIISNVIAIPLHIYKSFYLFTLMYLIFLIMAVIGHKKWVSQVQSQHT
jgi:nicotinamide mononucleotide transporter